ncbi:hypothetical protein niasHT_008973 [Heterodera trifolii]|uniref:Uncharacterized protein n=1 Tax=Heterodera trifolii TaxID=157864 RepID=A0ABD2LWA2_9BILA
MFAPKFLLILLVCVAFAIGTKHGKSARKMAKNDVAKDELEQAFSPLVPVELAQKKFEQRIDQMEKQLSEVIKSVRGDNNCMPKKGEDEEEEEDK